MGERIEVYSVDGNLETVPQKIFRILTPSLRVLALSLLSVLYALLCTIVLLLFLSFTIASDISFSEIIRKSFIDVITNQSELASVLYFTGTLSLTSLSVGLAFRAGLFNIGSQGQLMMGGLFAAAWGAFWYPSLRNSHFGLPFRPFAFLDFWHLKWIFAIPLIILVAFLAGGIYGAIPGFLKAYAGAHEVIVTIMMNIIATGIVTYFVNNGAFRDTNRSASNQTPVISSSLTLPEIIPGSNSNFTIAFFISVAICFLFAHILFRTSFGFRLRSVGFSPGASEKVGIRTNRMTVYVMALSGGVAGIAGGLLVMSSAPYRYTGTLGADFGFDGIAVSLFGLNHPILIIPSAFFFALLEVGANNLESTSSISSDLVAAFQGIVIIFISAPYISYLIWKYSLSLRSSLKGDKNNAKKHEQHSGDQENIGEKNE